MGEVWAIIWLVGLAGLIWGIWQWEQCRRLKIGAPAKMQVERALRSRTPEDCLACFVEWVNLTLRQGVPALIRRTWSTAQKQGELNLHLEWWRGYYHFVRPHQGLRLELPQPRERGGQRLPQRYRSRTPAMAAGVPRH